MRAGQQVLRIRRHGWIVADCFSVEAVAMHVDLAELCEVVDFMARTSSHHR
ncbi:hypothetical protein ACFQGX_18235 [Nonomuraea dietziae]|uniref:hypothetical protein n=1 Tax=Nonomuraea dietziae TaxID=65515 RepID=UPI00360FE68A